MGKTEFIFVRHAESVANAQSLEASAQIADPPLTACGLQQAADLANSIAPREIKALYTSDTERARSTGKPIKLAYGLEAVELSDIDEWNLGKGASVDQERFTKMLNRWCDGDLDASLEGAPKSETLRELIDRVIPAYQSIFEKHRNEGGAVVIIGHGGAISWTMPTFARNVSMRFAVENYLGNCRTVTILENAGAPQVVRWMG
ncbi:MAG: histidine phosphatase family protein [Pseudomonadota bacterium]